LGFFTLSFQFFHEGFLFNNFLLYFCFWVLNLLHRPQTRWGDPIARRYGSGADDREVAGVLLDPGESDEFTMQFGQFWRFHVFDGHKAVFPTAPTEVVVGVPADLLRRRPDVRRAERQAAAQSAQIGVAEADFYPHISIVGTIGYSASDFKNLFTSNAGAATVGPSFQWNILNYASS
jgi:hypothetical protein